MDLKEVLLQKESGKTYAEIASTFGVSRQRVQQVIGRRITDPVSGKCSRCGKYHAKLHRHHVNYTCNVVENICVSCHSSETNREKVAVFCKKVSELVGSRTFILGFEFEEIRKQLKMSEQRLRRILNRIGVKAVPNDRIYYWEFVNWSLPTGIISEIWCIDYQIVASYRYKHCKPKPNYIHKKRVPSEVIESEKEVRLREFPRIERQKQFLLEKIGSTPY